MIPFKTKLGYVDRSPQLHAELSKNISKLRKTEDQNELNGIISKIINHELNLLIKYINREGYDTPSSVRILDAHGNSANGTYKYFDQDMYGNPISVPITTWIEKHDGNYDVLMINSCNSPDEKKDGIKLQPGKSMIIYPLNVNNKDLYFTELYMHCLKIIPPKQQGILEQMLSLTNIPPTNPDFIKTIIQSYS